jgi:hypothetical protein
MHSNRPAHRSSVASAQRNRDGAPVRLTLAPIASAFVAAALAAPAHADVGVKMGLHYFDPSQPVADRLVVPVDSPNAISDAVARAWSVARPLLCAAIESELGRPDRFSRGVTLYGIQCRLQAVPVMSVRQIGPNALEVALSLKRNVLVASATTPTVVGSYGDPRASVDFDVDLRLAVAIGTEPARTLKVLGIHAGFSNTRIDSQNLVADLGLALNNAVAFLTGVSFKAVAEAALNGTSTASVNVRPGVTAGQALTDAANQFLAPVNRALTVPAGFARVGTWLHGGKLVLAFGPGSVPAPALIGSMDGVIRWPSSLVAESGCASFSIRTRAQALPSAITGPDLRLAGATLQDFGMFVPIGSPVVNGATAECRYRVTGLPVGYANLVIEAAPRLARTGSSGASTSGSVNTGFQLATLKADGWSGDWVVPNFHVAGRNYVATMAYVAPVAPTALRPTLAAPPVPGQPVQLSTPRVPVAAAPVVRPSAPTAPVVATPVVRANPAPAPLGPAPAPKVAFAAPVTVATPVQAVVAPRIVAMPTMRLSPMVR